MTINLSANYCDQLSILANNVQVIIESFEGPPLNPDHAYADGTSIKQV